MATVLAVFAHPDDETFICGGSLARWVAEGHRVVLAVATCGEMGRRMGNPPTETRETIGRVRQEELKRACLDLGIHRLVQFGFRDKTLEIIACEKLTDRIQDLYEVERPDVIVSFHEALGGHPDHCAIGRAATKAYDTWEENMSARLLFVAWPGMRSAYQEVGLPASGFIEHDVSSYLPEKLRAFRAHRTQSEINPWLYKPDEEAIVKLSPIECFVEYREVSSSSGGFVL